MSEETKQVWDNLFQKLNEKEKTFLAVVNNEKNKEIERLNNIINELEKELKDRIKNVPDTMAEVEEDESILYKLQELKGSDKVE